MSNQDLPASAATGPVRPAYFEAWADRLLSVWNDHDTTALPELVSERITWVDPARPRPLRGLDTFHQGRLADYRAYYDLRELAQPGYRRGRSRVGHTQ